MELSIKFIAEKIQFLSLCTTPKKAMNNKKKIIRISTNYRRLAWHLCSGGGTNTNEWSERVHSVYLGILMDYYIPVSKLHENHFFFVYHFFEALISELWIDWAIDFALFTPTSSFARSMASLTRTTMRVTGKDVWLS